MNKNWIATMSNSALFRNIPAEVLPGIINYLMPRIGEYKKNELVAIAGKTFEGVGFVIEGEVLVVKESFVGTRTIMANLKAGEMFGEIIAFTGFDQWPATVIAQTETRVMFISPHKILDLTDQPNPFHKTLIANFVKSISLKGFALNRKVEYLVVKSIKGKISKYLLEQYKKSNSLSFVMPLKRGELADFLNVSRPTLSREFGKLRDEQTIEFDKERVTILNLEELTKWIE